MRKAEFKKILARKIFDIDPYNMPYEDLKREIDTDLKGVTFTDNSIAFFIDTIDYMAGIIEDLSQ